MPDPIIAEFTLDDGNPVSVNLALVTHWAPSDDNTIIFFGEGADLVVRESYDEVSEILNPERQAGE
ncbi:hypothetical protein [Sphingobium sp. B11D3A]|uniref:hypothetical protein n=1 Tax=Sphingobium sp. B11D3A TaxID=2940574 RepID=UPI002225B19C|nr:hypothetical protein [Sphingobium sp. B11D3A]MCW2393521.1 uncharacterized protein YlzI (FlbEa/FlbD family) [Sphingobium sp. B11D3A]